MDKKATLTLGRDGLGEATEADFDAWVDYVTDNIEASCGFPVEVLPRMKYEVQADEIAAHSSLEEAERIRGTVQEAVSALWLEWCAEGAPGTRTDDAG